MIRNSRTGLSFAVVSLIALSFALSGGAAADESTLEAMEGEGTEDDPYVITDVEELQAMNEDRDGHYVLGNDIDASDTERWNAGAGFKPIGGAPDSSSGVLANAGDPFTGSFDGRNHTISGLLIDRPSKYAVGLFGYTAGPIENVHLEDADVRGYSSVAPLAARTRTDVRHASATGRAEASHSQAAGLVSVFDAEDGTAVLEKSSADVDITAGSYGGGLVAALYNGLITESYARGDVEVDMGRSSGGLVGQIEDEGELRLSYATGDVTAHNEAGGLVGRNRGVASESYAVGEAVSQREQHGGLTGRNGLDGEYNAQLTDSYWNVETSGHAAGAPDDPVGTGLRTDEMTGGAAEANMATFDFEHFWAATDEYPVLEWQVQDVAVSLDDSTVTEGDRTDVTVTLRLADGSTVTASETADYETDGLAAVDAGVVETDEQGTSEITATVAGESDTATLEITEPPNIELEETSLEAPAVVTGSDVTVTATYVNDGGPGGETAELIADGDVVASDRLWVEADDETTVEFEWTPDGSAGTTYDVAVDETALTSLTVVDADATSLESVSAPERIGTGVAYTVTADLETDHAEPVLATVAYELEGEQRTTESVAIDPDGSTATVEYESDADSGSTVAHTVTVGGEAVTETSEVTAPPAYEITDVDAPAEVESGAEFTLSVTIENTGGIEGSQQVVVSAAGDEVGATDLALEAGSSETVSVPVTEGDAAEYEYRVETDVDEATAAVTVTPDGESDDGSGSDGDSDGAPGFTVGLTAVALVATVVRLRRQ